MKHRSDAIDLLKYYFISLVALTLSGLIFKGLFVFYNHALFSSLDTTDIFYALFWGIRFDLAAAAFFSFISCLVLWLFNLFRVRRNPAMLLLLAMLLLQMTLQIGDTMYFAEAGRHVSYEMRDVFTDAGGLLKTALTNHILFILLSYLVGAVVIAVVLGVTVKYLVSANKLRPLAVFRFHHGVKLIAILLLTVLILRGGLGGVPQSILHAFKIGDPQQAVITMNGAYSIVYGAIKSGKDIQQLAIVLPKGTDETAIMQSLYPQLPDFSTGKGSPEKKYNLIFILMEGWPADFMSSYGYEAETTPFYTEIKNRSLAPLGVIAGGVRTTEGIYATFCSQQNPLGKTIAQTRLQNNHTDCLPAILKKQGWHTAFFQGTHKDTSGTGAFAQSLGFTDSFAKEDMPEGRYEHNNWGAYDQDIYDYMLAKIDEMPQPFLVGVNTNTTHDIKLPEGVKGFFGMDNRLHKHQSVLRFSDLAMREFFEKVKRKPYYKNTLFVLLSDHTHDQHKSIAAKYFIPGVIFAEDIVPPETVNRYVSQRDFAPAVLDILGLPASPSFAGKSFWSSSTGVAGSDVYFADYFDAGTIGWLSGNRLVETGITGSQKVRCYSIAQGLLNAAPVVCDEKDREASLQSLVFTRYSQDLLFSDRVGQFYRFAEQ